MDTAKDDKNKPKLSLVPKDIITNMARAEEYERQVSLGNAPKLITVTERINGKWNGTFECPECGKEFTARLNNVLTGNTKTCGCVKGEQHGESGTRLYRIYSHILDRCNNPKCKEYKWYGARGIRCEFDSYTDFKNFALSNGYNDELTVERRDVNKNYCRENITFIPLELQARNTRQNVFMTYKGLTLCAAEWAEILGCNADTLTKRKRNGWSDEKALEVPIKGKYKSIDISLVPPAIIEAIRETRLYGCRKYHDPENWRKVELRRYIDAFYRHWVSFVEDNNSIDEESGIPHYKHCACNMAFICELIKKGEQK